MVSLVATTGSSLCFAMSSCLGRGLVERFFPSLLTRFRAQIARRRNNLFFYLLFLRISPLLPNWFISVSAPILDIPFTTFAAATFFGLIPANYLHVTTGLQLEELGTSDAAEGSPVNLKALAFLFGIALLALVPTLCKRKFEEIDGAPAETTHTEQTQIDAKSTTEVDGANTVQDTEQQAAARRSQKKKVG